MSTSVTPQTDCAGKFVIRTSDRQFFKRCRELWNFNSKIRENWEPAVLPKPLEFGTSIHEAMETFYAPETWHLPHEVRVQIATAAFLTITKEMKEKYLKLQQQEAFSDLQTQEDFDERRELGLGMLANYFSWAKDKDRFTPKAVELEFEVPIIVPEGATGWSNGNFAAIVDDQGRRILHRWCDNCENFHPVVYQGRIDLLLQDEAGWYWIVDHKTAAQFATDLNWLSLDEQCLSYAWALQYSLGLRVAGVIYNELRKATPHPPALLKKGGYSKNKQQDTTYELYYQTLLDDGLAPEYIQAEYGDFLDYLKEAPKQWVRRTQVHYNTKMLQRQGERIFLEAIEMLGDPSVYPSPSRINCQGCSFFRPCLMKQEGSDYKFYLNQMYVRRQSTPELQQAPAEA